MLEFLSFPAAGTKHRLAYVASILMIFRFTMDAPQGKVFHGNYHIDGGIGQEFMDALREQGIMNGKGKFVQ